MKMRLAVIAITLSVLTGCTGFGVKFAGDTSAVECRGGPSGEPKLVVINIRYDKEKIDKPARACARPGDLLWFKVKSKKDDRRVSVEGKNTESNWISGGGKHAWFFVPVPYGIIDDGDDDGELFRYSILVEDGPDLDPEVRVRHNY